MKRRWEREVAVREIQPEAIREHGEIRFRSEYHYAVFEYFRSAKVIKQVDFRADFRGHHDTRGRTWSNVTLRLAECLHDGAISTTFSRNPIGTQTTVFNATVSWPTIRGYPRLSQICTPAPRRASSLTSGRPVSFLPPSAIRIWAVVTF